MPAVDILDANRKKAGQMELAEEIFGVKPNRGLVHEALVMQQANARQGTVNTKTRHFVSGGGVKPYRQKGTGRARAGSIRSPLFRKGGIIFGPHPRDYSFSMPKKAARLAMASVLSAKHQAGDLVVVDSLKVSEAKTKQAAALLSGLKLEGKTVILTTGEDRSLYLAARNLPGVTVCRVENINIFDLLTHKNLLTDKAAIEKLQEVLK